jgi:hypothetical protein
MNYEVIYNLKQVKYETCVMVIAVLNHFDVRRVRLLGNYL